MQFASIPMNLMLRGAKPKALYFETGNFAKLARIEAERYGEVVRVVDGESCGYRAIPSFDPSGIDQEAAYAHLTSNNTIYGTRWQNFPDTGSVPLAVDATSELLSRKMDYNQFGLVYAGLQKNLGPSGVAMMIVREDLLGHAMPHTPTMLDFKASADKNSLLNTTNTFAIYLLMCVLEWLKEQGGVSAIEEINEQKAKILYDTLDGSDFYLPVAHRDFRSTMNVPFHLPNNNELADKFISQALLEGMYALKGHALVGGLRASIYNSMPMDGVQKLADFMREFERKNG
jgi:phosphoserine aminotransferase